MILKQGLHFAAIPVVATLVAWAGVTIWLHAAPATDAGVAFSQVSPQDQVGPPGPPPRAWPAHPEAQPFRTVDARVAPGYTLSQTLKDLGLLYPERAALMKAMEPYVNPAHVAAGIKIKAHYLGPEDDLPFQIEFKLGALQTLLGERRGPAMWETTLKETPRERRIAAFSGIVTTSLWSSATAAGMDPQLISRLAEVFAWTVDFNRGIHEKDRWRLAIERFYADGEPVAYGDLVAAEFDSGGQIYSAVHFDGPGAPEGFYQPDGNSMRRLFLQSPLRYAHITSGFSAQRFHPILKVNKPHLGIDYGAPTGTPVMSVGEGVVLIAASRGPSGKMVAIKHNGLYETQYKHLSAFAKGVVPGAKVKTGQVIAYVGATGLATGPHLHFEFHVGGKYVDPQSLKFPSADPVPAAALAGFKVAAAKALAELPPWSRGSMAQVRLPRDDLDHVRE